MPKIVLLTEGFSDPHRGKTAASILRYRTADVVGVLDSGHAGRTAHELFGTGGDIPVRALLNDFPDADELLIGVAPIGIVFPPSWRAIVLAAIERGMKITNGLHFFLNEDEEFVEAARLRGVELWDVRQPPRSIGCSADLAHKANAIRIHTVGLDCAVGKMTASLEIDAELRRRGRDSVFLATGQTGIMIAGTGLPIDRMVSDFVAGGAESLVLGEASREFQLIEGQGSLFHPIYSGVTLGLLHGSAPDLLILCTQPTRTTISGTDRPMPSLAEAVSVYTRGANLVHPCRIVGIALNTYGFDEARARAEIERASAETGLPATDVIRYGAAPLAEALLAAAETIRR